MTVDPGSSSGRLRLSDGYAMCCSISFSVGRFMQAQLFQIAGERERVEAASTEDGRLEGAC